jgi:YggT family protein
LIATIALILGALTLVYMFVCLARVVMSWLPGLDAGAGGRLIAAAADPYLNLFRRIKPLAAGAFDFSPIAALAVLAIANDLLARIHNAMRITLGYVLGMILGAAWSAVAFLLSFLAVCAVIRLVAYAAHWNSLHPLWRVVDSMLNPVLYRINRIVYRGRIVNYLQGLITGLVVLAVLYFGGAQLVRLAVGLLVRLPV